jgi:putative Holliday junction resolvase
LAASTLSNLVFPVTTVVQRSRQSSLDVIAERLKELGAQRVIVGWPLNRDDSAGAPAAAAERFAADLRLRTGLEVELYDERLTSFEARERLRDAGRVRKRDGKLDAIAACVILESWLQSRRR